MEYQMGLWKELPLGQMRALQLESKLVQMSAEQKAKMMEILRVLRTATESDLMLVPVEETQKGLQMGVLLAQSMGPSKVNQMAGYLEHQKETLLEVPKEFVKGYPMEKLRARLLVASMVPHLE